MLHIYLNTFFQDINECSTNDPCKNGANCTNTIGGFQCSCASGFDGKYCDQGNVYILLPSTIFQFKLLFNLLSNIHSCYVYLKYLFICTAPQASCFQHKPCILLSNVALPLPFAGTYITEGQSKMNKYR